MWAVGSLIENVMNAGVMNIVPIKLGKFKVDSGEEKSKSHFVLAVELQNGAGNFFEIGRSGRMSLNDGVIDVNKSLQIPYQFAEVQRLKFVAYEGSENEDEGLREAGLEIITLGQIVTKQSINEVVLSNSAGTLQVNTELIDDSRSIVVSAGAEKLEKKDLFGKTDPYLEISRKEENGSWTIVHRTEHQKDTHNPQWNEFILPYNLLCGDNPDKDVKFACYDYDKNGNNSFIGEALISPLQIMKSSSSQSFALSNVKRKHKKKGIGRLVIKKCKIKKEPSFISYLLGDCRLQFTCGIDFTGSNGDPQQNSSLHYTGSTNPNAYVLSMRAVGRVLQEYASEKQISAYGYGAKIPPNNEVSHEFFLNLNATDPVCYGLENLLQTYCKTLKSVKLWGPTNFSPIINQVVSEAEKEKMVYRIILMLTDGVVSDMDETRNAIVSASKLPISILVVGIGNADFSEMEFLNKGRKAVKSTEGEMASRHMVKFLAFRNFNFSSLEDLGRSLLDEIPSQVVEYFTVNEIDPVRARTNGDDAENQEAEPSEKEETQVLNDPSNTPLRTSVSTPESPKQGISEEIKQTAFGRAVTGEAEISAL